MQIVSGAPPVTSSSPVVASAGGDARVRHRRVPRKPHVDRDLPAPYRVDRLAGPRLSQARRGSPRLTGRAARCEDFGWEAPLLSHKGDKGGVMTARKTMPRVRKAALLAALATMGAIAAYAVATASAQGRTLVGEFGFDTSAASGTSYYQQCGPPANAGFTIVLTEDGQPVTSLRPGTYWLHRDATIVQEPQLRAEKLSGLRRRRVIRDSGGAEQEITPLNDPNTVKRRDGHRDGEDPPQARDLQAAPATHPLLSGRTKRSSTCTPASQSGGDP